VGLKPTEHNGLFGKMSSVTTLTLRLVLPPLHCVTRPSGFTKPPLCLAPLRRAAQGTGLRACSPSSAQALLGSQSVCGIGCAEAASASVRRCRAVITKCPRPPQKAWRLQRSGRAGVARPPPPQGGSLYTALNSVTRRCGTWFVFRPSWPCGANRQSRYAPQTTTVFEVAHVKAKPCGCCAAWTSLWRGGCAKARSQKSKSIILSSCGATRRASHARLE
jgi:hypothetical protein